MGAIRGVSLVIISVLFFILLLVGNVLLILSLSLQYDNVQAELASSIKDVVAKGINVEEVMEKSYPLMKLYCQNNSEFVFRDDGSGYTFTIPCDVIAQGFEAIVDYGINSLVENFYYEDYDCEFWDCIEKTASPLFLVSEKAKNYWNSKFYLALMASIVLIVLIFFLVEKKSNLFVIVGSLLIISALPFMKLDWVLSFISDKPFLELLTIFFTKVHTVFLISIISGIVVLSIGILLKLFGVGFTISNIFSRFQKKDVKKDKRISKDEVERIVGKEVSKKIKDKKSK